MTETLETSLDIETRNQARSELAFGMLADAYPIVADQYNLDGKAYFGFVGPEEETSGAYSDFSFVIFPFWEKSQENNRHFCTYFYVCFLSVPSEYINI